MIGEGKFCDDLRSFLRIFDNCEIFLLRRFFEVENNYLIDFVGNKIVEGFSMVFEEIKGWFIKSGV